MYFRTSLQRVQLLTMLRSWAGVTVAVALACSPGLMPLAQTQAAINRQVAFQGRVVNLNGTNVSNGTFPFVFSIYTQATGGSAVWTESKTLTVTDSVFATNLGSSTSLPGSLNFNSDSLYLGINFNGDGEMEPRIRLTSVGSAFNAESVNGLTVSASTGTLTIPDSTTVAFGGAFTTVGSNPLTLRTSGATDITLPTSGTLATQAGTETLSNKTLDNPTISGTVTPSGSVDIGTSGSPINAIHTTNLSADGLTVASGASISGGINNNNGGLTNTGAISGATSVSGTSLTVGSTSGNLNLQANGAGTQQVTVENTTSGQQADLNLVDGDILTAGTIRITNSGQLQNVAYAGSVIGATYGGTGLSSVTTGDLLYGSGSNAWSALTIGTDGLCLVAQGGVPTWDSCALSGSGTTLQAAYFNGNTIVTTDADGDLDITLADTTTDRNFTVDIASGSTSKVAVQAAGTDVFRVTATENRILANGLTIDAGGLTVTGDASITGTVTGGTYNGQTISATAALTGTLSVATSLTVPKVYGSSAANGDITVEGTSDATKTTSYVLLQPLGGKVGIGTSVPVAALSVKETSAGNFLAQLRVHNGSNLANSGSGIEFAINNGVNTETVFGQIGSGVTNGGVGSETGYLLFNTLVNGTLAERMRVHSNGYLGIGDTSPVALLTVGNGDLFQVNTSGAIAAVTGITTSGGYSQSGTGANTFSGASSFTAAGTALSVTNNASIGGTLAVTGTTTLAAGLNGILKAASGVVSVASAGTDYQAPLTISTGLTLSGSTLTANLSTGVSGGQSVVGGTAASENLTLSSTGNGTKGKILFGTSAYDEANNRFGIGTASPGSTLTVKSTGATAAALAILHSNDTAALEIRAGGAGLKNSFLGVSSGAALTTGTNNTGVGFEALQGVTDGYDNTALGYGALYFSASGYRNTALGSQVLYSTSTGYDNIGIGPEALYGNDTGYKNIGIGYQTAWQGAAAHDNIAIGFQAMKFAGNAVGSVAIGTEALNDASSSSVAVGYQALSFTSGTGNLGLGYQAGYGPAGVTANALTTGTYNTFVGANTGLASTTQRSKSIAIGYNAVVNADNVAVIGGTGTDAVKLGIGVTAPSAFVHAVGTTEQLRLGYDASNYASFTVGSTGGLTVAPTGTNAGITLNPQGTGTVTVNSGATSGVTTASGLVLNANSLDTGTGLYIASSSLTTGKALDISVNGTAAGASQTGLNVTLAGTSATSGLTTYGAQIRNNHTDALKTGVNYGIYGLAQTAGTNYGVRGEGYFSVPDGAGTVSYAGYGVYGSVTNVVIDAGETNNGSLVGVYGASTLNSPSMAGTQNATYGVLAQSGIDASVASTTVLNTAFGLNSSVINNKASTTIGTGYAGYFQNTGTTGTMTNRYGIRVNASGAATNTYGLYLDSVSGGATNNFAIYSGGGQSVHAGNLRIGSTTAPSVALDVTGAAAISSTLAVTGNVTGGTYNSQTISSTASLTGTLAVATSVTSPIINVGTVGASTGALNLSGATSGTVTVQTQAAAGTYNFNLPTTAGSSGHVLTSAGGGAAAMTWTDPAALTAGAVSFAGITSGTNTAAAMVVGAGASLDFTSTGTINASSLLGGTWAAPGTIGSGTPNTGAFTTLTTTGAINSQTISSTAALTGTLSVATSTTVPTIYGSSSASGTLTLGSTSDATKGKILFGTSAYDEVNNRLGVGTASPSTALHVVNTAEQLRLGYDASNYGSFTVDSSGRLSVVSTASAVGIGTGTPINTLHVFNATNPAVAVQDTTNNAKVKLQAMDTSGLTGTESNHDFQIYTNNTAKLTVLAAGNVGIGTTGPDRKLDVLDAGGSAQLRLTYTDGSVYTDFTTGSTGTLTVAPTGTNAGITLNPQGTGSIIMNSGVTTGNGTSSSGIAINANSLTSGNGILVSSSSLTSGRAVKIDVTGTAADNDQRALDISVTGANAASSITSYGIVASNGHTGTTVSNTGIYGIASGTDAGTLRGVRGRISPTATANVSTSASGLFGDASNLAVTDTFTLSGLYAGVLAAANIASTSFAGTLATQYGLYAEAGITTAAAAGARTVSDSRGVFGVVSNAASGATLTNAYGGYFQNTGTTGTMVSRYGVRINASGTATNTYGLFLDSVSGGSSNNYAIYSAGGQSVHAGNLRVGSTTAPSVALDVTGAAAISSTLAVATSTTSPVVYGSSSASGTLTLGSTSDATKGKILFGTSGYDEANNRLGIGTASPATALDIVGGNALQLRLRNTVTDATLKNGYIQVGHYTNAEEDVSALLVNANNTTNVLFLGGGSSVLNAATSILFNTAANNTTTTGTTRLTIDSSGNSIFTGQVRIPDGSASAPGIAFSDETNTGLYGTSNNIIFSITGTARLALASTGITTAGYGIQNATNALAGGLSLGSAGDIVWSDGGASTWDVGLSRNAAGVLEVNSGSAGTLRDVTLRNLSASTNVTVSGQLGVGNPTPYGMFDAIGAVTATANYGVVNIGATSALFDGSSAGKFAGSAQGTQVAVNAASGFTGNLFDMQLAGVSKIAVDYQGNFSLAGNVTVSGTGTHSFGGTLQVSNISASGTLAITSGGNGDVTITAAGTGDIKINTDSNTDLFIGDGGTTNYAKFDQNGALTFAGAARPYSEMVLTAKDATTPTSNPCATGKVDATNHTYETLDCDASTDESAFWQFKMPQNYANGTNVQVDVHWVANATTGSAKLDAGYVAVASAADWNGATRTDVAGSATATAGTAYYVNTSTITLTSPSINAENLVNLRILRDADNGGDTLSVDAQIVEVRVKYLVTN